MKYDGIDNNQINENKKKKVVILNSHKIIESLRSISMPEDRYGQKIMDVLERRINSDFYRNKMIQYGFDTNKVIHIANPLKFSNTFELNLNDEKYFLFLGRLSREKGIKTIIDSMKDRNYTLKVLGTGPLSDELNLYVKDNNITNVELLGFKTGDELCNIVKRARCVVLPSEWYENGPYSAMEAMALGKPLIVSNLGGLPELVDNNINGYVYNDRKELSVALDKMIILDNESYTKMCQESLNRAKTLFNPEEYVKKLLSFIK